MHPPLPGGSHVPDGSSSRLSLDGLRFSSDGFDMALAGSGPSRDLLDFGLLGTSSSIDVMDLASILAEFNPPEAFYDTSAAASRNGQQAAVYFHQANVFSAPAPFQAALHPACWPMPGAAMPVAFCSPVSNGRQQYVPVALGSSTQVGAVDGGVAPQLSKQQVSRQKPNTKVASWTPQGWSGLVPGQFQARMYDNPRPTAGNRPRSPSLEGPDKIDGPSFASTATETMIPFRRSFTELLTADSCMAADGAGDVANVAVARSSTAAATGAAAYLPYPPFHQPTVELSAVVDRAPPRIAARAAAEKGRIQIRQYALDHAMPQDEEGLPFEEYDTTSARGGMSFSYDYAAVVGRPKSLQAEIGSADDASKVAPIGGWHVANMASQVILAGVAAQHLENNATGTIHENVIQLHQQDMVQVATAVGGGAAQASDDESWLLENGDASSDHSTGDMTTQVLLGGAMHRWTGKWEAHLWDAHAARKNAGSGGRTRGKQVYLGGYATELDAAHAYDRAAIAYWGLTAKTNFPLDHYTDEFDTLTSTHKDEVVAQLRRGSSGFARGQSKYRGVTKHHQPGKWEARIGRYLGVFDSEQAAAHAYDQAALFFKGPKAMTNFPHSEYHTAETFELTAAAGAHVEPDSAVIQHTEHAA
eukprot:gene9076-9246_t